MTKNNINIYIISDLHLSLSVNKPMDVFGEKWVDYVSRIRAEWESSVTCDDYVIIPGDISWAMTLEEATDDLLFLNNLPGKKILMKGNHDYWWSSLSKLSSLKKELNLDSLFFMHTSSFYIEECDAVVGGTRGWRCTGDKDFTEADLKIYKREILRFEMSLKDSSKYSNSRKICIFHYPPFNYKTEKSGFTDVMQMHGIDMCFFGHLHGLDGGKYCLAEDIPVFATIDGVDCRLVSSDYIEFTPVKVI